MPDENGGVELFPPIFQRERDYRVISDEVDRKVIGVYRPIGIKMIHDGEPITLWTGSFIARYIRAFDEIYVIPSNRSGVPVVMATFKLEYFGDEIRDTVLDMFGLPSIYEFV